MAIIKITEAALAAANNETISTKAPGTGKYSAAGEAHFGPFGALESHPKPSI